MHLAPTQRLALATVCLLAVNDPPALRVPKCLIRACAEAAPAASAAVPPPPPPPPSHSDVDVDALRSKLAADAKVGDYESAIAILERLTAAEKDKGRFPLPRLFDDTILACMRAYVWPRRPQIHGTRLAKPSPGSCIWLSCGCGSGRGFGFSSSFWSG